MSFVSDDLKLLIRSQRASSLDSANENNESFGKEAADPNHIFLRLYISHIIEN